MNTTALELIQAAFPDVTCTANLDAVVLTVQPEHLEQKHRVRNLRQCQALVSMRSGREYKLPLLVVFHSFF